MWSYEPPGEGGMLSSAEEKKEEGSREVRENGCRRGAKGLIVTHNRHWSWHKLRGINWISAYPKYI